VQLLQPPPWWTLARLLWVMAGVFAVFLIALTWGILIARKNALLNQAQAELRTANDQLEIRVTERTRELQDEVAAKERAHTDLAQAQQNLCWLPAGGHGRSGHRRPAQRWQRPQQRQRLRHPAPRSGRKSETHSLLKAAELLNKRNGDLEAFLTPTPVEINAGICHSNRRINSKKSRKKISHELERLAKKRRPHQGHRCHAAKAMRASPASPKKVAPASLVEDALQINLETLTQQGVTVIRRFEKCRP